MSRRIPGKPPSTRPPDPGWSWTAELDPDQLFAVARTSYDLAINSHRWVNRRVRTIELIDEEIATVKVSVDFRLPDDLPAVLRAGRNAVHLVPVMFLPRRNDLAFFDVCDEAGESLPLLTRKENADITGAMLAVGARRALGAAVGTERGWFGWGGARQRLSMSPELTSYLLRLPQRRSATDVVRAILDTGNRELYPDARVANVLLGDPDFRALLALAAGESAIHLPLIGAPGVRRIVKIGWRQPLSPFRRHDEPGVRSALKGLGVSLGWRARPIFFEFAAGGCQSEHLQVVLPPGVEACDASLRSVSAGEALEALAPGRARRPRILLQREKHIPGFTRQIHVHLNRIPTSRIALASVRLRASREGFLWGALLTSGLVAGLLFGYWRNTTDIVQISESAAAVLLLLPALVAGFLIRVGGEHAMARRLLRFPRVLTMLVAGLPLMAAGMLVVISQPAQERPLVQRLLVTQSAEVDGKLVAGWAVCFAVCLGIALALAVSCVFPRRGRDAPQESVLMELGGAGAGGRGRDSA